jgi:hypothetical protein
VLRGGATYASCGPKASDPHTHGKTQLGYHITTRKLPRKPQGPPLSQRAAVDKTFSDLALQRRMRAGYSPGASAMGGFGERQ